MEKINDFIRYLCALKHYYEQSYELDSDGGYRLYLPNGNWTYSVDEWIKADIEWQKQQEWWNSEEGKKYQQEEQERYKRAEQERKDREIRKQKLKEFYKTL